MPKGLVCSVCGAKMANGVMVNSSVSAASDAKKHKACKNATVVMGEIGKPQKAAVRAEKAVKADERKALTGRVRQGNHDSNTKAEKKGPKGDRHMNGVNQAGRAGKK